MSDIEIFSNYLLEETGLATVSTTQADGRILSTVVNCGIIEHPLTGGITTGNKSHTSVARKRVFDYPAIDDS